MFEKIVLTFVFAASTLAVAQQAPNSDFTVTLAGDSILHQRLSVYDDPKYLAFIDRIRKSDAAFVNLESQLSEKKHPGPAGAWSGGIYLYSPAYLAEEYKWAGFNLISVGNNHAFDYGAEGLQASIRILEKAGLVWAGAGENLAFARNASFLDTRHGRVALISVTSTLEPGSWASEQRPDLPGRFGLNPLRHTTTYTVDDATLQGIRKAANLARPGSVNDDDASVAFAGATYKTGTPGVHTEAEKKDLSGIIKAIKDAREQADYVIVVIHAHEDSTTNQTGASDFLVEFAHAVIDAGADVFANHAPHDVRGIELYKGRPIFYGLGGFAWDGHITDFQPSDIYDNRGLTAESTISDFWRKLREQTSLDSGANAKESDGKSYGRRESALNEKSAKSAVYKLTFGADHKLLRIYIDPIALDWVYNSAAPFKWQHSDGVPGPASPEDAAKIIDTITKKSAVLGTKVINKGDHAEIVLE
jgi:poly-gamma-glutamate capsule biosynthesis protein CapA/YwtB (metallophosphatase superfamily)